MTARLVAPTSRLHRSWLESRDEWGRGVHQAGASLHSAEHDGLDLDDPSDFRDWVEDLLRQADPAQDRPPEIVPATNLWIADEERYCGAIQLRHRLTPMLEELGGHIGYGVRPSDRGAGLAVFALENVLPYAGRLGLPRVLLTCDDGNVASYKTIEHVGGVLQDVREPDYYARSVGFDQPLRRYWLTI